MIDLVTLDHIITRYNISSDIHLDTEFLEIEDNLLNQAAATSPETEHKIMTLARDAGDFLVMLGYSRKVGANFRRAFMLTGLAPKTGRNDGLSMYYRQLDTASSALRQHPHTRLVIPAMLGFRHECLNGEGPMGCCGHNMGLIMRVACMTEALGQYAPHRNPRDMGPAIEEITGDPDITGLYDRKLMQSLAFFYMRRQSDEAPGYKHSVPA